MKKCAQCHENKSYSEFYVHSKSWGGHRPECKKCTSENNKQYRDKNRELLLIKKKEYYQSRKPLYTEQQQTLNRSDTKECSKCGQHKAYEEFHKRASAPDGKHSQCKACIAVQGKKRYKENKEEVAARNRHWREKNREEVLESKRKYYQDNRQEIAEKYKAYREDNKEELRERHRQWRNQNAEHVRSYSRAFRRKMKKATPPWLNEEHRVLIKSIYEHARDCEVTSGFKYHVDHEVPIKGKNVCGLHVPWNLQVLPQDINDSKGNKFDGGW